MRKIFILALTVFMVGCSNQKISNINKSEKVNGVSSFEQTKILNSEDLNLVKIDSIEIFKEESDKFIYFGRETCPVCKIYKPILKDALDEKNMQIYYFDTDYWRDKEEFNDILNHYDIDGVPNLIYLKKDGTFNKQELSKSIKDFENEDHLKKEIIEFIEKYKEI